MPTQQDEVFSDKIVHEAINNQSLEYILGNSMQISDKDASIEGSRDSGERKMSDL